MTLVTPRAVHAAVLARCAAAALAAVALAAGEPVVALAGSGPALDDADFHLELPLPGLGPAVKGVATDLVLDLACVDGRFTAASARAPALRTSWPVATGGLRREGPRLAGAIVVATPPPKEPADAAPGLRLELDVAFTAPAPAAADAADERWRPLAGSATAGGGAAGAVSGRARPVSKPGRWDRGDAGPEGLALRFDLGRARVNWTQFRAAILELPASDLRAFGGVRVALRSPRPRADAAVSVWLREGDGSWYYLKSAIPLVDAENAAEIRFADFANAEWIAPTGSHMDEDYVIDLADITHLAIGVVNPFGVGEVACTVTALEWLPRDPSPPPRVAATVTGRTLAVNGHELVPAGIFGGYAPDLAEEFRPGCQRYLNGGLRPPRGSEQFIIDCHWDIGGPPLFHRPDWKEHYAEMGRTYAAKQAAAGLSDTMVMEFGNEPYLRFKKGNMYAKTANYNVEEAAEDAPVRVVWRDAKAGTITPGPVIPALRWRRDGDGWKVVDPTQFTFWSGQGHGWQYDQMLAAYAPAFKAANPRLRLIAGWGFRWNEDHWAAWDLLYKPTIDAAAPWLDGIDEHHYQGDTTAMNGSYEVLAAYGVTAHGKWLHSYNTETSDLVDAPARGAVDTPAKAAAASQYRKMVYNLRDCLYCVKESPDKLRARTVIHAGPLDGRGAFARVAYGIMRDLRGRLVEATSSDERVWCVASIDGSDPGSPPPTPGRSLVAIVYNDDRVAREVAIALSAPAGTTFAGAASERTTADLRDFSIALVREPATAAGTTAAFTVTLPPNMAWKVALPLQGDPAAGADLVRTQAFSPLLLQTVARGAAVRFPIAIDRAALAAASRAWLRLVVEDVAPGEARWRIHRGDAAGAWRALPPAWTADNVNRIVELDLALADLAEAVAIEFAVAPGNHAGYRVDLASVMLERRR